MKLAEFGELYSFIEHTETPFSERMTRYILDQLVEGTRYLHNHGIVHRDIKTLNIFLADEDFIKIGDLGVARFMSTNTAMAETVVGTPFYMSPELFEEKPYRYLLRLTMISN